MHVRWTRPNEGKKGLILNVFKYNLLCAQISIDYYSLDETKHTMEKKIELMFDIKVLFLKEDTS